MTASGNAPQSPSNLATPDHVRAILEAGQILASALSSNELQSLSESADMYPYQPLTLSEGHRKIEGIVKTSEETA